MVLPISILTIIVHNRYYHSLFTRYKKTILIFDRVDKTYLETFKTDFNLYTQEVPHRESKVLYTS